MYKRPRIIPCLTMQHLDLVKTVNFKNPRYIGDPINSVRIFNNKDVDELCILDITATIEGREPDYAFLHEIAGEAFMPLGYGGGIRTLEQAKRIFKIGYEKIILNSLLFDDPGEVEKIVDFAGSQSVVASIDYRKELFGRNTVLTHCGQDKVGISLENVLKMVMGCNVGEILLTSIEDEGRMTGYDLKTMQKVNGSVDVPVVLNGGAGSIDDIRKALDTGADAVAVGSFFIYYGSNKAILINTPSEKEYLEKGIYEY